MTDFDDVIKQVAAQIRERLRDANLSNMRIDIEISGPVQSGAIKIEYKIGESYGHDDSVKGHRLSVCLEEFLRRKGWTAKNAALEITYAESAGFAADNPDISF